MNKQTNKDKNIDMDSYNYMTDQAQSKRRRKKIRDISRLFAILPLSYLIVCNFMLFFFRLLLLQYLSRHPLFPPITKLIGQLKKTNKQNK